MNRQQKLKYLMDVKNGKIKLNTKYEIRIGWEEHPTTYFIDDVEVSQEYYHERTKYLKFDKFTVITAED